MIRNNTKVYLIKWHQVARASLIEQGLALQRIMPTMPQGRPVPTGSVVPDGSSGSQEPEPPHRYRADLRSATCALLVRHVGGRANRLAKQQLTDSWKHE